MDSALSSTFTNVLSARESATVVDFGTAAATDATADRGLVAGDQFSVIELDFEARNWNAARWRFQNQSKHEVERINEFLSQHESPQQAREFCVAAQGKASKQYAPIVGSVLSKIEALMRVGDLAMKGAPESVGLAWMGIRLCMHSVQDDFATFNLFSGAASDIIAILLSCRAYGKMYGGDGGQKGSADFKELHQKVVDFIPKIYSDVLEFSYQMRKHMGRSVGLRLIKGLLSSAVNKFKGMIDGIRSSEQTMSKYASKATQQLTIYYEELGLQKQDNVLGNQQVMMTEVAMMRDLLQENARGQKIFEDHIKEMENEKKHMRKKTPRDEANEKFEANKVKLKATSNSEDALDRGREMRSPGTCEWIFDLDGYKDWKDSEKNNILWIQGDGGMGKSVLMARLIDQLMDESKEGSNTAVQYFICSSRDESTQLTAQIQNQLVYGLYVLADASSSPETLDKANKIVEKFLVSDAPSQATGSKKETAGSASFKETYKDLIRVNEKRIHLVIDALDECKDRKSSKFLKDLKDMIHSSEAPEYHLNVVLCSRPESDILEELSASSKIRVQDHNGPDIELDAKASLEELPGLSPSERTLACEAIVKKAQGLFRCVDPAIDFLKKPWKRPLEKALEKMPDGLTNSYQQIFRQTDPQYLELLKTALQWCILGKRKPTIAEVMDDYTCAYEQEDGDDINPYDRLLDPTTSSETKLLIHNQFREAGSNTFLEIESEEQFIKIRHATVTDFFLPAESPLAPAHGHDQEHLCPECKLKVNSNQTWTLSKKEGHLRMAITIFKHLNSPLFRKRYLTEDPVSPDVDANFAEKSEAGLAPESAPGDATEDALKSPTADHTETPKEDIIQGSEPDKADKEFPDITLTEGDSTPHEGLPSKSNDENGDSIQKPIDDDEKDLDAEKVIEPKADLVPAEIGTDINGADAPHEEHNPDVEIALEPRDDIIPAQGGPDVHENNPDVAKALESKANEIPTQDGADSQEVPAENDAATGESTSPEQKDDATDDEDDNATISDENSVRGNEDEAETSRSIRTTGRYEIVHWPNHLQEAEALWSPDEKRANALWKELYDLVIEFMCDSPGPYRVWQLKYQLLPDDIWGVKEDEILTPLQIAAAYGLTGLSELLIQRGESATATTINGCSALWFAVIHDIELIRLLLLNGADPNYCEGTQTPFHRSIYLDQSVEKIKLMLDYKADTNQHSEWEMMSIHWCGGWSQDPEILRLLLANGADINALDDLGETGLHKLMNRWETPKDLLEEFLKAGANVNLEDNEGQQPLYEVCNQGSEEGCRMLLEVDPDIEHEDIHGITALHAAARNGSYECEKLLIEKKASLTRTDKNGRTPFWHAASNGWSGSATLLMDAAHEQGHDSIITLAADDGRTALSKAGGKGHLEVVKAILGHTEANIDINAVEGSLKRTVLHWAAKNGRTEVVSLLLEHDADATIKDADGKTALNLSAMGWPRDKQSQREPLILALIDRDSAAAAHDIQLMTNAAIHGSVKVLEKLIDIGTDPSKQDEHGWTPLQLARQYNHEDAAAVLAKRGAVVGSQPSRFITDLAPIKIIDGISLEDHNDLEAAHTILTNHPIPAGIPSFYFEATLDTYLGPHSPILVIGATTQPARLMNSFPGWYNPLARSWGYHSDDGNVYTKTQPSEDWKAEPFSKGDTVGFGVVYGDDAIEGRIFFTKEGKSLGWAFENGVVGRLYPAVGLGAVSCTANFGEDLEKKPYLWTPANAKRFGPDQVDMTTVENEEKEEEKEDFVKK